MATSHHSNAGLTLIELMVSLAIIAVMAVTILFVARTQINRAHDAQRKSDIEKIKIAFEDYYTDNSCYPPADILSICGDDELQPYLAKIPCDPTTKDPYLYLPVEGAQCSGYRLFTQISDSTDPAIARVGCGGGAGCGVGLGYNYGVSAGVSIGNGAGGAAQFAGSRWACSPSGTCNFYNNPIAAGCNLSFAADNCNNLCSNPAVWCTQ